MRIIIHSDQYDLGGSPKAKRMRTFVDAFTNAGHEVLVLTASQSRQAWDGSGRAETVRFCPTFPLLNKSSTLRFLNQISFGLTSLIRSLFIARVDIVLTTSPPPLASLFGYWIARIKRARLIYDVRDIWPDVALEMNSFSEDSFFCKVFNRIKMLLLRRADLVSAVSPGKVMSLRNSLEQADDEKVQLIENGFDLNFLDNQINEAVVARYQLASRFTVVYTGNIGLAQNLDALLDLAKLYLDRPDMQFLLFGHGASFERLLKRVEDEGIKNVTFAGTISYEDTYTVLRYARISYIPLKNSSMKDSIPTKTYEALGLGCPVLLVAEGDSVDLLEETGLGSSVSPERIDQLPAVFADMLANYDAITANRGQAMAVIRDRHSRQSQAEKLERLISAHNSILR